MVFEELLDQGLQFVPFFFNLISISSKQGFVSIYISTYSLEVLEFVLKLDRST